MSREIKFRAWHKGVMLYNVAIINGFLAIEEDPDMSESTILLEGSDGSKQSFYSDWATYKQYPESPIMQFTGLQDKNSKDIYESDIISDHVGVGVVKYSDKYAGFRVCYGDGQCKWFYDYILNGERESIEVIGNIDENPELLKHEVTVT